MFLQADPWKFDLWENTQADSWLSSLQMSEGSIQKFFEQETYLFYNQLSENKCLSSTTIFNVWLAWSVLYKWLQPQSYNDCTEKPGTVKDSEVLRRAIAKKQKQMSGTALRKEKSEGRKFTLSTRIWGTALLSSDFSLISWKHLTFPLYFSLEDLKALNRYQHLSAVYD